MGGVRPIHRVRIALDALHRERRRVDAGHARMTDGGHVQQRDVRLHVRGE
jgi:hypothetical protein